MFSFSATISRPALLLASLLVFYSFLLADRQMTAMLVEPLKADLRISDVEFSLLHGFIFAVGLGLFGLVGGRFADTRRRVSVITVGLAICSAMTIASGFMSSYAGLLLCRFGVAVGQAAFTPSAHSLIADSFDRKRLGLALGIFGIGPYLGIAGAYFIGGMTAQQSRAIGDIAGWVDLRSWQFAFLAVGAVGVAVTLWSLWLREAPRSNATDAGDHDASPDGATVFAYFRRNLVAFGGLKLSTAFASMAVIAIIAWYPSHLMRNFGWLAADTAAVLGPMLAMTGMLGVMSGGCLADFAASRRADGRPLAMAICAGLGAPCALAAPLMPASAGLALCALAFLFASATIGINPSATMAMMPGRMRGMASAIGVLLVNMIGLGLGPTIVALVSDSLPDGPRQLSVALAITLPPMMALAAICAAMGCTAYRRAVIALDAENSRRNVAEP